MKYWQLLVKFQDITETITASPIGEKKFYETKRFWAAIGLFLCTSGTYYSIDITKYGFNADTFANHMELLIGAFLNVLGYIYSIVLGIKGVYDKGKRVGIAAPKQQGDSKVYR